MSSDWKGRGAGCYRLQVANAWVVSWEGLKLDSMNSSLAISKVEIAHLGIEVVH